MSFPQKMIAVLAVMVTSVAPGQQTTGTIRGQVTDSSGALIPGAAMTLTMAGGQPRTQASGPDGSYSFAGLAPGSYTLRVNTPGFAAFEQQVTVAPGQVQRLNVPLRVALEKQEVTVSAQPGPTVSTEAENNASSLVLRGEELAALPDDPDDLAADLQALAGPSAGPNGGQMYIDGFTGGRLPPKESIREIRINQNPFSAEYDRLGFGRIEVFTKPGSDKFRGQVFVNYGNAAFNSRNPYAANRGDFQSRMFSGNVSGPITKKSSFFLDMERRDIDDNAIVHATTLDPSLNLLPVEQAILTPHVRTTLSPRVDYQLSPRNTLVGRYTFTRNTTDNAGIGEFALPSRAYNSINTEHTAQLTETAVLSAKVINETRFQFIREDQERIAENSGFALNVLESFQGGGAPIGHSLDRQNHYEIQNYTSVAQGTHTVRFGVRVRSVSVTDISPQNFGGTFTFGGGLAPVLVNNQPVIDPATNSPKLEQITSLERYRRTLLFQQMGLTPAEIRALGGMPTQFSIAGGTPLADVNMTDAGIFIQDDWRLRPNFTLSGGLRYETQTNIHDWRDIGPRIGFAWAPGGTGGRQPKTVIRGGFGIFYNRFDETLTLDAIRYNGLNQQQYIVSNPAFYPNVPTTDMLAAAALPQTLRRVDQTLRAPYVTQTAIGIERQLPYNTTVASTFTWSHGVHLLRSRNVNAPLPGTLSAANPQGLRPYGDIGDIYLYESTGRLNQNQWMTNVNSRVNRNVSIFAFYVLNHANSDTDGPTTFPSSQYDLSEEYGRAAIDVRHRFVLGGSVTGPFALRFAPFIIARSGTPFNITTGRDLNGDQTFTDRPGLATDLSRAGVIETPFGAFDPQPLPGEILVPRNYGDGPGYFTINLRLSRTFGFGAAKSAAASGSDPMGGRGGGGWRGGGMRMGGGGGMRSIFSDPGSERRYSLTLAVQARNLLNNVNPAEPIGNLTSPVFGQSIALANSFGPGGTANNRRIELQLRFNF
jgi:hypothetical protein